MRPYQQNGTGVPVACGLVESDAEGGRSSLAFWCGEQRVGRIALP
jgi:hypothetical protein